MSSLKSSKTECNVCCDVKNKFIKCLYCSSQACSSCYETYALEQNITKCMFCNKEWNYEFVQTNFTKVFVNGKLKKHNEKVILDREKAMMPETQKEVEVIIHNEKINDRIKDYEEEIRNMTNKIALLKNRKLYYNKDSKRQETQQINYPCPKSICRGFLNSNWKCGLCNVQLCKDCREEVKENETKEYEHKCNPDVVANIKELQKDSKPCPKCATSISKISGCFIGNSITSFIYNIIK
jgi:hypothetical protein